MKSIIEENNQIPELFLLRHQHDSTDNEYDYVSNTLKNSTSGVLWDNDNTHEFMSSVNNLYISIVDSILPVRNIFFWSYNKYYNKHGK